MTVLSLQFIPQPYRLWLSSSVPLLCCLIPASSLAISPPLPPPISPPPHLPTSLHLLSRSRSVPPPQRYTCPIALEPLATAMVRDLPSYINRLQRRIPRRTQRPDENLYTIAASLPELDALPIGSAEYASPEDAQLQQVFFTTLERQYTEQGVREWQSYHWLFLSPAKAGWQLALLFSRQGDYPRSTQPLTPPQNASQSVTALAIRTWLRDCQAGAIKPLQGQITIP